MVAGSRFSGRKARVNLGTIELEKVNIFNSGTSKLNGLWTQHLTINASRVNDKTYIQTAEDTPKTYLKNDMSVRQYKRKCMKSFTMAFGMSH